jgi:hypothetical protein
MLRRRLEVQGTQETRLFKEDSFDFSNKFVKTKFWIHMFARKGTTLNVDPHAREEIEKAKRR